MTELDDDLVPDVADLINNEVGTDATFKEVTGGTAYSPSTSTAAPTTTDRTAKIAPPWPYDEALAGGDTMVVGQLQTILAAQGLAWTPTNTMTVTFGGETWRITRVAPIRSGDSVCAYLLDLER